MRLCLTEQPSSVLSLGTNGLEFSQVDADAAVLLFTMHCSDPCSLDGDRIYSTSLAAYRRGALGTQGQMRSPHGVVMLGEQKGNSDQ